MSAGWYRIPEWCALADDPDEITAAVWLLGRWHLGRTPAVAELKRATGWGWDRCNAFADRLWTWAETAGATRPDTPPGKSGSKRGGATGKSGRLDIDTADAVEADRGANGEAQPENRGASRARYPLGEREKGDPGAPDPSAAPQPDPPPSQPDPDPPPEDLLGYLGLPLQGAAIALVRAGTETRAQLLRCTPDELRHTRGVAGATARRIAERVAAWGDRLAEDQPRAGPGPPASPGGRPRAAPVDPARLANLFTDAKVAK